MLSKLKLALFTIFFTGVIFINGCTSSNQSWFGSASSDSVPSPQAVLTDINNKTNYVVTSDDVASLKQEGLITDEELSQLKETL